MKTFLTLTTASLLAATFAAAADTVPLKTDLPAPMLVGTPVPVKLPNLEAKPANASLPVPVGTVNLAAGKTVTASDSEPLLGDLTLLTDGDLDTEV